MGFFNLKSREEALWPADADTRRSARHSTTWWLLNEIVALYVLLNLAILVVTIIPPYNATDGATDDAVAGWAFPLITCLILLIGTIYYVLFFGAAPRCYEHAVVDADNPPPRAVIQERGILRRKSWWNWMRLARVQCEVRKSYTYDRRLERVYRFGRRWRVIYYVPGDAGYQENLERRGRRPGDSLKVAVFLYWFFGGSGLNEGFTPVETWEDWWSEKKRQLRNLRVRDENGTGEDD